MARLGDTVANTVLDTITAMIDTVGLSTTEPAADGSNITEPTGNAYARVTAPSWTAAASRGAWNSTPVLFPEPTGSWGIPRYFVYRNSLGAYLAHERVGSPVAIGAGATVLLPIGALLVRAPS